MKRLINTLFLIAVGANMAIAADRPDFSGTWMLDLEKSAFGAVPPPAGMTRTIDQKGTEITVQQAMTGPDLNVTLKYFTDGKETANSFMGTDFKSTAGWEGKVLVIHNVVDAGGTLVKSTDKWTLSEDGKTFTDVLSISSPDGEFVITHVLTRQ